LNKSFSHHKHNNDNHYNSIDLHKKSFALSEKKKFYLSQNKENHTLLHKNKNHFNFNDLNFVDKIVDYSNTFGFMYTTNKNIIGIVFNDKSCIQKYRKEEEFNHIYKQSNNSNRNRILKKTVQSFSSSRLNDVPSEIRMKYEILSNYEKYLDGINGIVKENTQIKN